MAVLTLLGIDATNWVHQLWHAQRGLGVVAAVRSRVRALTEQLQPAAVVSCFDRRSFRHDLAAGYKAGRKEKSQDLVADLQEAERQLAELGTVAAEEGAEADDCLATLAAYGRRAGAKTIIASPDKDLRQCLGGQVLLLRSFATEHGRPCKADWYTDLRLFDETGLEANQWVDYQCLVGDRTDGIDGCPKWGDKTAAAVLAKMKTIEACFANPWLVPCTDRQRRALIEWHKSYPLTRQLVTLRVDVACVWDALR